MTIGSVKGIAWTSGHDASGHDASGHGAGAARTNGAVSDTASGTAGDTGDTAGEGIPALHGAVARLAVTDSHGSCVCVWHAR
jgi:hypothetical protein